MSTKRVKINKIAGAMYGFAIGDAMGATTEFMIPRMIQQKYGQVQGIIGGGWLNLNPGDVTDDTQMTMCVADAIIKAKGDTKRFSDACIENFIRWYKSNPPDVGAQCAAGIQSLIEGGLPGLSSSAGNGSLMRALPCALIGNKTWNEIQCALTHRNPTCNMYVRQYHDIMQNLLFGYDDLMHTEKVEPTGYVANTFANAVYWANTGSFADCIIGAVNDGGDADTIAAIAGSLSGAIHGYEAIPKRWIDQLNPDVRYSIDRFIDFVMEEAK